MSKQNLCSVCQKEAAICNCAGCKAFFCTKDFTDHRQWLSGEFEKIVEARNHLLQKLNEKDQINHLQTTLCSQIDQWEGVTLEKVRCAAIKTRDDVIRLLNDEINGIENEFDNVTKQLRALEEMNNFVEDDLTSLNSNIDKLGKELRQITEHSSVILNQEQNDQIEWTSVIYATDKCAHDKKVNVSCPFADAKCFWTGSRDQLDNHLFTCSSGSPQSKLHKFHNTNKQLNEQAKQQKNWIDMNASQIGQLRRQLKQLETEVNGYETKIHQLEEHIKKQKVQFRQITERLKQRNIQINKNADTILLLKEQLVQKNVQVDANETEINELKEEINQQKISIDTEEVERTT